MNINQYDAANTRQQFHLWTAGNSTCSKVWILNDGPTILKLEVIHLHLIPVICQILFQHHLSSAPKCITMIIFTYLMKGSCCLLFHIKTLWQINYQLSQPKFCISCESTVIPVLCNILYIAMVITIAYEMVCYNADMNPHVKQLQIPKRMKHKCTQNNHWYHCSVIKSEIIIGSLYNSTSEYDAK